MINAHASQVFYAMNKNMNQHDMDTGNRKQNILKSYEPKIEFILNSLRFDY